MKARPMLLPALAVLVVTAGCFRMPKIIVLEDPLTAAEHVDLGVAYERKGEISLARREYDAALRKDGKCFRARVNLGNISLQGKEYGNARREYLRALELRPGDAEAANNLAWVAILQGEGIDEALARMEGIAATPEGRRPEILDTLGVLRMHASLPGPAEEALSLAEGICAGGVSKQEGETGPSCTEQVRAEIAEHRRELRKRFPSAFPPSNR